MPFDQLYNAYRLKKIEDDLAAAGTPDGGLGTTSGPVVTPATSFPATQKPQRYDLTETMMMAAPPADSELGKGFDAMAALKQGQTGYDWGRGPISDAYRQKMDVPILAPDLLAPTPVQPAKIEFRDIPAAMAAAMPPATPQAASPPALVEAIAPRAIRPFSLDSASPEQRAGIDWSMAYHGAKTPAEFEAMMNDPSRVMPERGDVAPSPFTRTIVGPNGPTQFHMNADGGFVGTGINPNGLKFAMDRGQPEYKSQLADAQAHAVEMAKLQAASDPRNQARLAELAIAHQQSLRSEQIKAGYAAAGALGPNATQAERAKAFRDVAGMGGTTPEDPYSLTKALTAPDDKSNLDEAVLTAARNRIRGIFQPQSASQAGLGGYASGQKPFTPSREAASALIEALASSDEKHQPSLLADAVRQAAPYPGMVDELVRGASRNLTLMNPPRYHEATREPIATPGVPFELKSDVPWWASPYRGMQAAFGKPAAMYNQAVLPGGRVVPLDTGDVSGGLARGMSSPQTLQKAAKDMAIYNALIRGITNQ